MVLGKCHPPYNQRLTRRLIESQKVAQRHLVRYLPFKWFT